MTPLERKKPDILNASRKRRIAAGSGVDVAEVNRLLKQHRQMADMFKAMSRGGGRGLAQMAAAMGAMGGGGMGGMGGAGAPGLPPGLKPPPGLGAAPGGIDLERLKALGSGKLPGVGGPQAPGAPPGLGGFPGFKKK
jgi:signal recognition particle subunit SRP54